MVGLEPPGRRIVAIALLRHRQRDDAGFRRGEARDQRGGVLGRDQNLQHRADEAQLRTATARA